MQTLHLLDISYLKTQLMETLFCLFYQDLRMNNEAKLLSECTVRCCRHCCHDNILSTLNCKLVWLLLENDIICVPNCMVIRQVGVKRNLQSRKLLTPNNWTALFFKPYKVNIILIKTSVTICLNTVNSRLADTPLSRTPAITDEIQIPIYRRRFD